MKNLIFILPILVFASCQKNDTLDAVSKSPKISAEVDGKLREGTAEASFSKGMLYIDTWDGIFGIDLYIESAEVGEYLLGQNQYNEATMYLNPPSERITTSNYDTSTYGKVIITEFNKKDSTINGTFEFIALNSVGEIRSHVKNGKFENIKISKNDHVLLNKMSFKVNGLETKYRESGVSFDSTKNISFYGSKWIRSEFFSIRLPDSIFQKGSYTFSIADTARGKPNAIFFPKINHFVYEIPVSGKIAFVKKDSINRILQASFEFELKNYVNDRIKISDGFLEVHY